MGISLKNVLGLNPSILTDVKHAVKALKEKDLVRFGTCIHHFNGFSVQF